jgi:hypothetical protein
VTEQTLKRFVGALVVVAALWAVTAMLSSDGDSGRAASGDIAVLFDGVSAASVTAVRMSSASGDTELSTSGGAWSVNGFASDSGVVARFWAMITTASVGQLVATNPINHERMSITDADAWTLEFDVAGETTDLNSPPRTRGFLAPMMCTCCTPTRAFICGGRSWNGVTSAWLH